jgi:LAS superfamily LD-carboxypeptidase LdcB
VTPAELTGRVRSHIVDLTDPACALHSQVRVPFQALRRAATAAGFDLYPASGFRDFARQLSIWNGKFNGTTPLSDASGRPIDAARLAPRERIDAILEWSALPGASRHHWGTDLDVIDRRAMPEGYRVRLAPDEFTPPGPFAALSDWLEAHAPRFGFFRPYRGVLSGVRPEPWHMSFAPIAEPARRRLSPGLLRDALSEADLAGKRYVLERIEELHTRYVAGIDWP